MNLSPNQTRYVWVIFSRTNTGMGRLIRIFTGAKFNHVSICPDGNLNRIYSFARRQINSPLDGGFVHESPERLLDGGMDTPVEIYSIPLSGPEYDRIENRLSEYSTMQPGKLLYNSYGAALSVIGVHLLLPDAYTCLDFTAGLLEQYDILSIPAFRRRLSPFLYYRGGLRELCLPVLRQRKLYDPYFNPCTKHQIVWRTIRHFTVLSVRLCLLLSLFY